MFRGVSVFRGIPVFRGVPGCSRLFGCSGVPGLSTCQIDGIAAMFIIAKGLLILSLMFIVTIPPGRPPFVKVVYGFRKNIVKF